MLAKVLTCAVVGLDGALFEGIAVVLARSFTTPAESAWIGSPQMPEG